MKGKTKQEKAITLIALIITIVVLLILAAVAINSIVNEDLIAHAENVTGKYNNSVTNEQTILGGYEEFLNNYNGGSGSDTVVTVTPNVGQYVEYDVSYDDIYNSTSTSTKTFGKTDGWRYLGTESGTGNHLLISTGVPMILYYKATADTNSAQWWDATQSKANAKMVEGLKKKLSSIPYEKVSAGTTIASNTNTMIGLFGDSNRTTVGDYFKVTGKTYSNSIHVRTLTLEELNRAVNSARQGETGYTAREETATTEGFKDIPSDNIANGLFDLSDIGLSNDYYYWLASPRTDSSYSVRAVNDGNRDVVNFCGSPTTGSNTGVRPVVVLPSTTQFIDADNNNILEIKEN